MIITFDDLNNHLEKRLANLMFDAATLAWLNPGIREQIRTMDRMRVLFGGMTFGTILGGAIPDVCAAVLANVAGGTYGLFDNLDDAVDLVGQLKDCFGAQTTSLYDIAVDPNYSDPTVEGIIMQLIQHCGIHLPTPQRTHGDAYRRSLWELKTYASNNYYCDRLAGRCAVAATYSENAARSLARAAVSGAAFAATTGFCCDTGVNPSACKPGTGDCVYSKIGGCGCTSCAAEAEPEPAYAGQVGAVVYDKLVRAKTQL